jgi:hypothetical protein
MLRSYVHELKAFIHAEEDLLRDSHAKAASQPPWCSVGRPSGCLDTLPTHSEP